MHVGRKGMDEAAGFLWLLYKEIGFSHAKAQGTFPFKGFFKSPLLQGSSQGPWEPLGDSHGLSSEGAVLHLVTADLWLFLLLVEKSIPSHPDCGQQHSCPHAAQAG